MRRVFLPTPRLIAAARALDESVCKLLWSVRVTTYSNNIPVVLRFATGLLPSLSLRTPQRPQQRTA
eukprot:1999960-Amphidinium_carterae.2